MILAFLSLLIIITYVTIMIIKTGGIPYSISDTYYSLTNKYWFGACMIGMAALLLPAALEVSGENSQCLIFLAVVGMGALGVSPNFKGSQRMAHYIGAAMALGFSQIWVGCNAWHWLLLWGCFICYMLLALKKHWTGCFIRDFISCKPMFWIEILSLFTVYLTLV